jgi:hypothetical protein
VQEARDPEAAIDQHQVGFDGAVPPGGVHVVAEAVAVGGGIAPVAQRCPSRSCGNWSTRRSRRTGAALPSSWEQTSSLHANPFAVRRD